jgi:hypothetical protein
MKESVMDRDLTELKARYAAMEAAIARWEDIFSRVEEGSAQAKTQLHEVSLEVEKANQAFGEEYRHFTRKR